MWNPSIKFIDMVHDLSHVDEKEFAYDTLTDEWADFFKSISKRDVIIYNLTINDIQKLHSLIELYNNTCYNQLDIEDSIAIFLKENSFEYDISSGIFKKIEKSTKIKKVKDVVQKIDLENTSNIELNINNKRNEYLASQVIYINNNKIDNNFNIFNLTLDTKYEHNIINQDYLLHKIEGFFSSNFTNVLLGLLKVDWNNNAQFNYLFYLVKSYEKMQKFNNFDCTLIKDVNNAILNNKFNYLSDKKFFNLDYINLLFKNLDIKGQEKHWSQILFKTFNNNFLFLYCNASDYLLKIFNILNNEEICKKYDSNNSFMIDVNVNYLFNLENFIKFSNYNNLSMYNLHESNCITTFRALFELLNNHILIVNKMFNLLNIFNEYITNIYLNYCESNKNNMQILRDLYFIIYNNKNKNIILSIYL